MEILIAVASAIAVEIPKALVAPVSRHIKALVAPISRHIGYLTGYELNIKDLKEKLQKLKDKKTVVDRHVAGPTADSIIQWKKKVDDISKKGNEFFQNEMNVNKCFNTNCPDPMSRYSLSKKAEGMTKTVLDLLKQTEEFGDMAHPGINLGSAFITEGIRDFRSRESIKNEVWEALKDDNLSMISICGTGGVGKTTMVKELVQRVEREKLFDVVGMAVVSQTPNIKKIQGDIASWLNLKLDDENELKRAGELRQGLINHGKRILIILDDVWSELDFEKIGLPSRGERKGHKIMLTSRNMDECNKMESEKNITMKVLEKDEARDLFREMAGISNVQDLHQTATEIADECGGLPLAIVTIAKGLKNKGRNKWDDTLQRLKNSNLQGVSRDVFSRIELSYKLLEDEEAKSCFLLCSLFPEDFNVPVEDLVRYGMGLRLFKNVDKVHHARTRVYNLIDELKESFLLLEGDRHDYVKMHDIVRDVAISIASRDKQWHTLQSEAKMKWLEEDGYKHCIVISLSYEKISDQLNDLEYPKLELLQIWDDCWSPGLPNNVYAGMKELKVLALSSSFTSLPQSLDVLRNLRTLCLEVSNEHWGRAIGALVKLEILEIRYGCSSF
ncbi:disease resistance protein At4g27190-like [Hevea brasiliensis]|uniref:disease resistance protein At4g27190-like n=1 Tax=Hevea brasiliensis TaxID=3981 RepID=UPI0025E732F7|nr:disease resistance protein At4g27190-like [Hevea brasiliensis]